MMKTKKDVKDWLRYSASRWHCTAFAWLCAWAQVGDLLVETSMATVLRWLAGEEVDRQRLARARDEAAEFYTTLRHLRRSQAMRHAYAIFQAARCTLPSANVLVSPSGYAITVASSLHNVSVQAANVIANTSPFPAWLARHDMEVFVDQVFEGDSKAADCFLSLTGSLEDHAMQSIAVRLGPEKPVVSELLAAFSSGDPEAKLVMLDLVLGR